VLGEASNKSDYVKKKKKKEKKKGGTFCRGKEGLSGGKWRT